MKLELSPSAARTGILAAIAARVFCGLMVEADDLHNGAWLSVIIALALALPLALNWSSRPPCRPLVGLLAALLALDAATVARVTAFSAGYLAFDHIPTLLLAMPLLLAALRCSCLGGDAIGWSARIWLRVFTALLAVVLLVQWPNYRPRWLTPVLGYGLNGIVWNGIRAAGWMAALAVSGATLVNDTDDSLPLWRVTGSAALLSIILIVLRLMMTPSVNISETMTNRLDSLLTNGRSPLMLQLPIIVMWYVAQAHLIAFQCFAAAGLLQRGLPGLDGRLCCTIASAVIGIALLLNAPNVSDSIWFLMLLGLLPLVKEVKPKCAS